MNENIETKSLGVDKGRVKRAFGQEARALVSSEQTGDAFCMLRFFIPPGNVTPPHLHRATDETFLIESGEIEINRGGELLRGRKGDVIYLPIGIPHALRVIGNEGVALVVCVRDDHGLLRRSRAHWSLSRRRPAATFLASAFQRP